MKSCVSEIMTEAKSKSEKDFTLPVDTAAAEPIDLNSFAAKKTAMSGDQYLSYLLIFEDTKTGYAIGYGLNSPIGPIEVKYSWSPDTDQNFWFFNVGFWF